MELALSPHVFQWAFLWVPKWLNHHLGCNFLKIIMCSCHNKIALWLNWTNSSISVQINGNCSFCLVGLLLLVFIVFHCTSGMWQQIQVSSDFRFPAVFTTSTGCSPLWCFPHLSLWGESLYTLPPPTLHPRKGTNVNLSHHSLSWRGVVVVVGRSNLWSQEEKHLPCVLPPPSFLAQSFHWSHGDLLSLYHEMDRTYSPTHPCVHIKTGGGLMERRLQRSGWDLNCLPIKEFWCMKASDCFERQKERGTCVCVGNTPPILLCWCYHGDL